MSGFKFQVPKVAIRILTKSEAKEIETDYFVKFEETGKMKHILKITLLLLFFNLSAQEREKIAVQKTIETFFEGFHRQDSVSIKKNVAEGVVMQRIATDSTGKVSVQTQDFSDFLKAIASIPPTTQFEEIIKSYAIQVDGPMANAWTPYEFKINGTFHHCGVNSFQLFKDGEAWKIIYIVDTRRENGCGD